MINQSPKDTHINSLVAGKTSNKVPQKPKSEILKKQVTTNSKIEPEFTSEISNGYSEIFDSNNNGNSTDNSFIGRNFPSHTHRPSLRTYGLRPRTELRKPSYDCDSEEKEISVEVVRRPRSHNKGSLMSKYRRRTANARERHRMREINAAFSTLRGILPPLSNRRSSQVSMTKIRTLRLAASYIQALSDLLQETDAGRIKSDISSLNSSLGFQHYSDSFILHKIQAAKNNSLPNFHASLSHKAKRQRNKNTKEGADGGGVGSEDGMGFCGGGAGGINFTTDANLKEEDAAKFFRLEHRIPIGTPDPNSESGPDKNLSLKNSWEISHQTSCEKDFLSILEEESTHSSDIDGSLNSWVDYKTLEDLYFALN